MKKILKSIVLIILFTVLILSASLSAYFCLSIARDRNLSGEWTAQLDMSEHAAVTALDWLQDMEAVSVSLQDLESRMQGLTIDLHLTMEQTARSEGTFVSTILPESYAACSQTAYEAFASAFRELVAERLRMAGYAGGTDEESVETLIMETFGMPTTSYLLSCEPNLLPPLEDLQAQYDGSGTYKTAEGTLTRQFDSGSLIRTRTEPYVRKDTTLILTEETDSAILGYYADHYPVIYTLQPDREPQQQPTVTAP